MAVVARLFRTGAIQIAISRFFGQQASLANIVTAPKLAAIDRRISVQSRLDHDLEVNKSLENRASERFVSSLRACVLSSVAGRMRSDYEQVALPKHLRTGGSEPENGMDVHKLLRGRDEFNMYSSLRCATQELVWNTAIDSIGADAKALQERYDELTSDEGPGSLTLNSDIAMPRYADAVDVHLMPGNYDGRDAGDTLLPGAVYDNGFNVFAFGMMGKQFNDIGCSMANYLRLTRPNLQPKNILDVGCTIGHNTLPWKDVYPDAAVVGVDVAAASLRYAHARARSLGVDVDFRQQNAEALEFDDNSMDVVFSSMFLHELPEKAIRAFLAEAHRVLRPGGVMLNMELPPNSALQPYDQFYLDWDGYYNNEPFYKGFRDQDPRELCSSAGFPADAFFDSVMPRYTFSAEEDFVDAINADAEFDDDTGRLSFDIRWYGFGSQKAG